MCLPKPDSRGTQAARSAKYQQNDTNRFCGQSQHKNSGNQADKAQRVGQHKTGGNAQADDYDSADNGGDI